MNRYEIAIHPSLVAEVYATDRMAAIRALNQVFDQFEGRVDVLDVGEVPVVQLGGVTTITIELTPATAADIVREEGA